MSEVRQLPKEAGCFHCGRDREEHVANDPHCVGYMPDHGDDSNAEMIRRLMGRGREPNGA